jgi:hypothetical protein
MKKPRRVAPLLKKRDADPIKMRRRISAFILLNEGWSLARVAAHLKIRHDELILWESLGCPLNF